MGAQNATGTTRRLIPVTLLIAALLTVWFVTQQTLLVRSAVTPQDLAVHPEAPYQVLTYLTALISHWSVEHLAGNLFGLIVVGTYVEFKTDARTVIAIFCITAVLVLWSYVTACSIVLSCGYFMRASVGIYGLYGVGIVLSLLHSSGNWSSVIQVVPAVAGFLLISRQLFTVIAGNYIPAAFHVIGGLSGILIYISLRIADSNR